MSEFFLSVVALIIFALLAIYVIAGSFMEHKHFVIGHETGVAILIGMGISGILWATDMTDLSHIL